MTAPRAREHRRPPSPPDRPPPRRSGRSSPYAVTAAGRPAGFARLGGARRALSRSARAVAAVACLCLAGAFALPAVQADTTDNGPHDSDHNHFYLWRTTMTVGESSGELGYKKNDYGSISTDADFGYPPFNPPRKHHFDPDYNFTVEGLFLYEESDVTFLTLSFNDASIIAARSAGEVALWIGNTGFRLSDVGVIANQIIFSKLTGQNLSGPDLDWSEDEEVRVALVYERRLPSAPTNVRVTAPPGEDGTLEVSWDEPEFGGTFPVECYLVEFRHPSGEAKKRKQSYPGSLGPGKGCGDSPPTSVTAHGPRNGRPIPGPCAGVERRRLQRVVGDEDGPHQRDTDQLRSEPGRPVVRRGHGGA